MNWRAPLSMAVLASMLVFVHGFPDEGTFGAFTTSDGAGGVVRAGRWGTSTPPPPTPNPCIGPPPEHKNMCIRVPVRGSSGPLPPLHLLPTPEATVPSSARGVPLR